MYDKELREQAAALRPDAVFDHRHPIAYEDALVQGVQALVRYFAALARRDLRGMSEQLHFPHAAIEGTEVVLVGSAEELLESPPPSMDVARLPAGSFDLLLGLQTHTSDPVRAGLTLSYSRHGRDGMKRCVCDGLYVATLNNGRWGLHVSSTIFTPVEHLGIEYPEAVQAVLKRGHDWMEGWSRGDAELLDSTRTLLGRSVTLHPSLAGRNRDLPELFRTEGVDNRLRVHDDVEVQRGRYDFAQFRAAAGSGRAYSHTLYRHDARIVHQSRNKVHVAGGYTRYQQDQTPISTTWSLGVQVRRGLVWGDVAGTGNTVHYDSANDPQSEPDAGR